MTASMSASLPANTRKMVPSAIPAASAMSWVVTISPCSRSRGRVAAMIIERRSSAGRAVARRGRTASLLETGVALTIVEDT